MARILQESLVALKTILKEIDPYAFEEAMKMNPENKKKFEMKQNEDDRKRFDEQWEKLNKQLKSKDANYSEPALPFVKENLISDYNELYKKIYDKEKFVNL